MINYRVIGLSYTRKCPLECRDCIVSASPRVNEKMTPEFASDCIKTIPKYSNTVCFTGGEPMLYYNEIIPLMKEARSLGLYVTMVTGCGWVRTDKAHIARERIAGLKEAGLSELCVSWDAYHEEFAPKENPLLVLDLCKEFNIPVTVRGVIGAHGIVSHIEQTLVQIGIDHQNAPLVRLGNAETLPEDHFKFHANMDVLAGKCGVVTTPVIEYDGKVWACCGPSRWSKSSSSPLFLGDMNDESLDDIFYRSVRDPILEAISTMGPYGLFRLIEDDPELHDILPVRARYTGHCELCLDLMDLPAIVDRIRERLTDRDGKSLLLASRLFANAPSKMKRMTYDSLFV